MQPSRNKHSTQDRRDIDRGGVERDILGGFSRALDPVDMIFRALLQEGRDAFPRVGDASPEFLQLGFQKFVFRFSHHLADPHLQGRESPRDLVLHEIRPAHPVFAPFLKIRPLIHCGEKAIRLLDQRRGQRHPGSVACDSEKSLLGARVVEPLDGGAQSKLRNADPDLPRGHLLESVRFVEDQEVVREKIAFVAFLLLFQSTEEHEEQRVIDDHHVGREEPPARLLKETTRILSAGLGGADVRFAANLCPDLWIGFNRQIAQGAVDRCARPVGEPGEIGLLGRVEKFVRALHCALQAARTKIILPAFHERGLELDRENLFHDRDVLVQQLFLEVDRVRRMIAFFFFSIAKRVAGMR